MSGLDFGLFWIYFTVEFCRERIARPEPRSMPRFYSGDGRAMHDGYSSVGFEREVREYGGYDRFMISQPVLLYGTTGNVSLPGAATPGSRSPTHVPSTCDQ